MKAKQSVFLAANIRSAIAFIITETNWRRTSVQTWVNGDEEIKIATSIEDLQGRFIENVYSNNWQISLMNYVVWDEIHKHLNDRNLKITNLGDY